MIFTTLVMPVIVCSSYALSHYNYARENPGDGAKKYPQKVPTDAQSRSMLYQQ